MAHRSDVAGWIQDPSGRHQLRYHDGIAFTPYVSDYGAVSLDTGTGSHLPSGPPSALPGTPVGRVGPSEAGAVAHAQTLAAGGGYLHLANPYAPNPAQWGSAGAYVAPTKAKGRRLGLSIAVSAAVLEAVAIVVLSVALVDAHPSSSAPIGSTVGAAGSFSPTMGHVVYSSHFGASDGWDTGTVDPNTRITLSNGQYRVTGWTAIHHALLTPDADPQRGMSVATGVTDYPGDDVSMGVGCQSASGVTPALIYQMVTYPDGQWYIEEARVPGTVETLVSGVTGALGTSASLQLTCVITDTSSGAETTQLVAYVNGTRVGAIGDVIHQQVGGYIPILVLGTFGPTASASFTSLTVRRISPPA